MLLLLKPKKYTFNYLNSFQQLKKTPIETGPSIKLYLYNKQNSWQHLFLLQFIHKLFFGTFAYLKSYHINKGNKHEKTKQHYLNLYKVHFNSHWFFFLQTFINNLSLEKWLYDEIYLRFRKHHVISYFIKNFSYSYYYWNKGIRADWSFWNIWTNLTRNLELRILMVWDSPYKGFLKQKLLQWKYYNFQDEKDWLVADPKRFSSTK